MPERKAVTKLEAQLPEATISTFSFMDDETVVKLHIPLAGAASLPAGSIQCDFRDRSFDLRVRAALRRACRLRLSAHHGVSLAPCAAEVTRWQLASCVCECVCGISRVRLSSPFGQIQTDTRLLRLHVPITHEEIEPALCALKPRQGKLIVVLAKRDASKHWYELRKTKGVCDTEYAKIIPDAGEATTCTV